MRGRGGVRARARGASTLKAAATRLAILALAVLAVLCMLGWGLRLLLVPAGAGTAGEGAAAAARSGSPGDAAVEGIGAQGGSPAAQPLPFGGSVRVTDAQVRAAARAAFGDGDAGEVVEFDRIHRGGVINMVFRLVMANQDVVYAKFGSPFWRGCGKLAGEAAVMRHVTAHTGVPVPQVLAVVPEGESATGEWTPEVLFMSALPGSKMKDEIARPVSEVTPEMRRAWLDDWARTFAQLRTLRFPAYGSFGSTADGDIEVVALHGNAGCSNLGPFDNYADYAAAKVAMFLPLLRGGACNEAFAPYIPRIECLVDAISRYEQPADRAEMEKFDVHKSLDPVLLHHDLSVRNILVERDPPHITGIIDWDFAMAGPAEEELTFPATLESHGDSVSAAEVMAAFEDEGLVPPPDAPTRRDHVIAYWDVIVACHAAAWQDDPLFTEDDRQATLTSALEQLKGILIRHSC